MGESRALKLALMQAKSPCPFKNIDDDARGFQFVTKVIEKHGVLSVIRICKNRKPFSKVYGFNKTQSAIGWITKSFCARSINGARLIFSPGFAGLSI
ncbi:hypothetical protein KCP71_17530 [Salmonella enterica subsp. enterica]|nr:hypothetical protein KCP71_17530 [Salmonella enterica subsp. enterica]